MTLNEFTALWIEACPEFERFGYKKSKPANVVQSIYRALHALAPDCLPLISHPEFYEYRKAHPDLSMFAALARWLTKELGLTNLDNAENRVLTFLCR